MSSTEQPFVSQVSNARTEPDSHLLDAILKARNGLRFGSIEITVHDGKVTQIERKEKIRFQT